MHAPPHRLHHIYFFQTDKSHRVPETIIFTKKPSPVRIQTLDLDSCFIHFHVKLFLSASCVVYWSAVRDSGGAKMKTSWNYLPFLLKDLKDLNTIRAV